MKLYFAWTENLQHWKLLYKCGVTRWLATYYYLRKSIKRYKIFLSDKKIELKLDSWAFTAFTKNEKIDIEEYITFVKNNEDILYNYAWLDVIWDAEATLNNQKILDKNWLKAFPTYHLWSPIKYFHNLVENYDYIGLWWMVPHSTNPKKIKAFLDYCFHYIKKKWLKTKIHWWGMTNPRLMLKYPFYSVDSTAWLTPQKYNRVPFFKNWKFIWIDNKNSKKYGIDYSKMHFLERTEIAIKEFLKLEKYITEIQRIKKMDYYNY